MLKKKQKLNRKKRLKIKKRVKRRLNPNQSQNPSPNLTKANLIQSLSLRVRMRMTTRKMPNQPPKKKSQRRK